MQDQDLGRALVVITGASRGFGRAAAREVSRALRPGSALVLAARCAEGLRSLQEELTGAGASRGGLQVRCVSADLSLMEAVESLVQACRETFRPEMDHVMLVNNAASLGDVSRFCRSFTNMADVDSYLSFNVSSCLSLTAGFLQAFPKSPSLRRSVVNVTSICAVKPYPSWVLYCGGKAAREMMFRVLAEEEPDVRVLSYSPGPLDTDMMVTAKTNTADPGVKNIFDELILNQTLLTCQSSCVKMLQVLLDDQYTSGAHVDFYDP